jgi:hypothetical protein
MDTILVLGILGLMAALANLIKLDGRIAQVFG